MVFKYTPESLSIKCFGALNPGWLSSLAAAILSYCIDRQLSLNTNINAGSQGNIPLL